MCFHTLPVCSVRCQLIRLFARGIEEEQQQQQGPFEDPCTLWDLEPNSH